MTRPFIHRLLRPLEAVFVGAITTLAFAPYSFWPIAILSPAILLILLHKQSTKNALWWGKYAFWVAGIEGMILEVARAANTQDVILTGGDAIWFSDQVVNQRREDWPLQDAAGGLNVGTQKDHSMEGMRVLGRPHLVLEGLRHLSRRSCS